MTTNVIFKTTNAQHFNINYKRRSVDTSVRSVAFIALRPLRQLRQLRYVCYVDALRTLRALGWMETPLYTATVCLADWQWPELDYVTEWYDAQEQINVMYSANV